MLNIKPFAPISKTLRELGYKVERVKDRQSFILAYNLFDVPIFGGTRRQAWDWLIETKQIRRPW